MMTAGAYRPEKVIAVVPAYNEEGLIAGVLRPLVEAKAEGIIQDIVVVDDGSTDKTSEIARSLGVGVISHGRNIGKTGAFMTAAEWCRREDATIMFMTDADMLNLTPEKVGRFLSGIKHNPNVDMIRAESEQWDLWMFNLHLPEFSCLSLCPPELSGFRAVRMTALEPMFRGNRKWMGYLGVGGYGLELSLERLIGGGRTANVDGLDLKSRRRGGGPVNAERISKEIFRAGGVTAVRNDTAERLMLLRELRRLSPEDSVVSGKSGRELRVLADGLKPPEVRDIRDKVKTKKRVRN